MAEVEGYKYATVYMWRSEDSLWVSGSLKGLQSWQQTPLPAELSLRPQVPSFKKKKKRGLG